MAICQDSMKSCCYMPSHTIFILEKGQRVSTDCCKFFDQMIILYILIGVGVQAGSSFRQSMM